MLLNGFLKVFFQLFQFSQTLQLRIEFSVYFQRDHRARKIGPKPEFVPFSLNGPEKIKWFRL